jgi:hypothetical protein
MTMDLALFFMAMVLGPLLARFVIKETANRARLQEQNRSMLDVLTVINQRVIAMNGEITDSARLLSGMPDDGPYRTPCLPGEDTVDFREWKQKVDELLEQVAKLADDLNNRPVVEFIETIESLAKRARKLGKLQE